MTKQTDGIRLMTIKKTHNPCELCASSDPDLAEACSAATALKQQVQFDKSTDFSCPEVWLKLNQYAYYLEMLSINCQRRVAASIVRKSPDVAPGAIGRSGGLR